MLRGIGIVLVLGLSLYALVDCIRTDAYEVKGLPKVVWVLIILFVAVIGPIAWLVVGRNRASSAPAGRYDPPSAPDDDREFLDEIDRRRRERERRSEDDGS